MPYSSFVLLEVRWRAGTHSDPHRISESTSNPQLQLMFCGGSLRLLVATDLMARNDNRQESMHYPTAPWA